MVAQLCIAPRGFLVRPFFLLSVQKVAIYLEPDVSIAYSLNNIQERGQLFIGPQEEVGQDDRGRKRATGRLAGRLLTLFEVSIYVAGLLSITC